MSLKIIVSICRKLGQPNYGSLGASCTAEAELPNASLDDSEAIQQAAKDGFFACEQAVNDQLTGRQASGRDDRPAAATAGPKNGNGAGWRQASEKQMTYVRQLATRIDALGVRKLETLSQKMFGTPLAGLSSFDASKMIDVLKQAQAGIADLEAVLGD